MLFLSMLVWRVRVAGIGVVSIVFLCLFGFFLFYWLNYRTLIIRITPVSLVLTFGIFRWTVPLDTIEECHLDDAPMWRIGGAGIHFSRIHGRYRAMLNFLEYPRVVIALRRKRGIVRDIVFSTRQPEEVQRIIQNLCRRVRTVPTSVSGVCWPPL
jgi:hypothetical protein